MYMGSGHTQESLIKLVGEHDGSGFYRDIWGSADPGDAHTLPLLTASHLIETPLSNRMYKHTKGVTKIIKKYPRPFLVRWSLEDIREEPYIKERQVRPLILLADPHDALEKSLWCYENDIIPLVGEHTNLTVTVFTAQQYDITTFVTDSKMVTLLTPMLEGKLDTSHIDLILMDDSINEEYLVSLRKVYRSVSVLLSRAECGAIAHSCSGSLEGDSLVFHPVENVTVEMADSLVMTKLKLLTTPFIRYDTGIPVREIKKTCSCEHAILSFELTLTQ